MAVSNFLSGFSKENVGNLINLAGDALGTYGALKQDKVGSKIAGEANPFGKYREGYGADLARLMDDPNAFSTDPAYTFARDQGLEAVTRKMNSSGFAGSGNQAAELLKYASGFAQQYRGQELDRLAQLAGANIAPASAASAITAGGAAHDQIGDVLNDVGAQFGITTKAGQQPLASLVGGAGTSAAAASSINAALSGTQFAGLGAELTAATDAAMPGLQAALGGTPAAAGSGVMSSLATVGPLAAAGFAATSLLNNATGASTPIFWDKVKEGVTVDANNVASIGPLSARLEGNTGFLPMWNGVPIPAKYLGGRAAQGRLANGNALYEWLKDSGQLGDLTKPQVMELYERLRTSATG